LVISSNFYKSSWDDTLLITLLLVTIRALAKLTNKFLAPLPGILDKITNNININ
jgi:hypothetical protein